MLKLITATSYFIIGVSIAAAILSSFYLGRITAPPVPVCALGRSTEYPVLKPLYVKALERAMPAVLHEVSMMLPPVLPFKGGHHGR